MKMKHSEAFEKLVNDIRKNISEISIETFISKKGDKESPTLIDVREDHERNAGSIPDSIHLGRGIIERDIEKHFPSKNAYLVLYCGGGYRSALACDSLQRMGYTNIYSLEGGYRAWITKELPISK
jgi:rhodanese-related sulfurtransferase